MRSGTLLNVTRNPIQMSLREKVEINLTFENFEDRAGFSYGLIWGLKSLIGTPAPLFLGSAPSLVSLPG